MSIHSEEIGTTKQEMRRERNMINHSLIIYTISGNRIILGPKSFVSYQISIQIDPINPLGLVSGEGIDICDKVPTKEY